MIAVAGMLPCMAWAQDSSSGAIVIRTCENLAVSAFPGCTGRTALLYEKLNRAFVAAHRVAPQDADEAAQELWMAKLHKRCFEWTCVRDALAHRTMELRAIEMRSYDVADKPMTDAEAKTVCADVAAIESRGGIDDLLLPTGELTQFRYTETVDSGADTQHDGQLENRFPLELRKNEPRDFGTFMGRGTCVMFSIEPIRNPNAAADEEWPSTTSIDPESEDELHLIGWGGGESVLAYRGRHYIATHHRHGIAYLEWLTPAATRRGLCTFEDNGFERIVTARLDPHADCDALARMPGEEIAGPMSVDLDNDGHLDSIGVDGEDSGAGCGHSWRSIKLLDARENAEVSPRNEALGKLSGLEGGPVMLLTLKNKEYVYANSEDVPTVYSVTKTGIVPQCEFRIQYKRRVKTEFPFKPKLKAADQ